MPTDREEATVTRMNRKGKRGGDEQGEFRVTLNLWGQERGWNLTLIAAGSPCRKTTCSDLCFKNISVVTWCRGYKSENKKAIYETYCRLPGERWGWHALGWCREDERPDSGCAVEVELTVLAVAPGEGCGRKRGIKQASTVLTYSVPVTGDTVMKRSLSML